MLGAMLWKFLVLWPVASFDLSGILGQHAVDELTDKSFAQHMKENSVTAILFYAPWCFYSQQAGMCTPKNGMSCATGSNGFMVQDWNQLCRPDDMALEVVGRASQKLEPVKRSTLDWDLQSCRSTSLGSDSSAPFAFSHATETDLGSCESVCSFPGTTNHAFFRLHRRSAAVNKIKPKESKGVYHCLEQELWPNRKVTNYQLCFGKGAGRVGVCRSRAWKPPVGRPVQKTLPATKGTQQAISRPLDDSKSDSPPVSELGSLPLTDIAMTPSTSSRPSRPQCGVIKPIEITISRPSKHWKSSSLGTGTEIRSFLQ
eukprot:symbB.v1.2.014009.t1/scaffold1012.1/size144332/2